MSICPFEWPTVNECLCALTDNVAEVLADDDVHFPFSMKAANFLLRRTISYAFSEASSIRYATFFHYTKRCTFVTFGYYGRRGLNHLAIVDKDV